MKKSLFILLTFLPFAVPAQKDLFASQLELLGTKADSIYFTDYLLNEPADKSFHTKFKVLEFWATWCKPCLRAVPHLNKLQHRFKERNIVFLSVTYERPEKASQAFRKTRFETVVVTDTTRSLQRRLRVDMNGTMPLPRTVLIDDENKIVWYGDPDKLTPALIEKFLKKEKL